MFLEINEIEQTEVQPKNEVKTEIKGDTIRVYHNQKIVYLKIVF